MYYQMDDEDSIGEKEGYNRELSPHGGRPRARPWWSRIWHSFRQDDSITNQESMGSDTNLDSMAMEEMNTGRPFRPYSPGAFGRMSREPSGTPTPTGSYQTRQDQNEDT